MNQQRPPIAFRLILTFFFALFLLVIGPVFEQSPLSAQSIGGGVPVHEEFAGSIDLCGTWLMKDYARGIGLTLHVNIPGKEPQDCLPVTVPGTVRNALLNATLIPDPYVGYENEKSLWVEEKEWWFFKKFSVGNELKGKWIDLVFEGASFQGEVWLNGERLGDLKGMLNPRSFAISHNVHFGAENTLAVRLEATPDVSIRTIAHGVTWDTPRDQLFSIAQCMYGWDWGPHGVPIGLWKPVKLRVSGSLRLDRPYVRSTVVSAALATCDVRLDVQNLSAVPRECIVRGSVAEEEGIKKGIEFQQTVRLAAAETRTLDFKVSIPDPQLWWPNGMGEHPLYVLRASVSDESAVSEHLRTLFGIRELKLVENDSIADYLKTMKVHAGSVYQLGKVIGSYPWTFLVNGKKMFAKGANWIPVDQLLRLDRDRYDRLLTLAREAHFNLLRVWGGGLYETDDFYDLCDRYGILAWQEFLSNRSFSRIDRDNFLEGAESSVVRIRNHPSLTFWCGGNEFDPDDAGSKAVIDALEGLLKKLDPQREFHRASPYMGDDHHWGVWHFQEPYTNYRIVRPFRSEAGVNTFPVPENYRKFTPPAMLWPMDTTYIEFHGEYNTRFMHLTKLNRYADEFGPPTSIDDMIRKSELYQALANSFNMEFCRSNKFKNSGLLIWQYNDIWPCISWSMVDWYGTPKPSYYYQKRASRPVHVCADYERYAWKAGELFSSDVFLLNDGEAAVKGCTFAVTLIDVGGKRLAERLGPAEAPANASARIGRIEYRIPGEMTGRTFFVSVELRAKNGDKISDALYPIAVTGNSTSEAFWSIFDEMNRIPAVDLRIRPAESSVRMNQSGKCSSVVEMSNPTNRLAFFIRLRALEESESFVTSYSDNYISLLPGETKTITVTMTSKTPRSAPSRVHFEVSGWNSPVQTVGLGIVKQ